MLLHASITDVLVFPQETSCASDSFHWKCYDSSMQESMCLMPLPWPSHDMTGRSVT